MPCTTALCLPLQKCENAGGEGTGETDRHTWLIGAACVGLCSRGYKMPCTAALWLPLPAGTGKVKCTGLIATASAAAAAAACSLCTVRGV